MVPAQVHALVVSLLVVSTGAARPSVDVTENVTEGYYFKGCSSCGDFVDLGFTMGLEWVLFPPSPMPNPIATWICTPKSDDRLWDAELKSQMCDPDVVESMTASAKENCKKQEYEALANYASPKQKSDHVSGIMGAMNSVWSKVTAGPHEGDHVMKQFWICGRCGLCKAWEMVKNTFSRLKRSIGKGISNLKAWWEKSFGYSCSDSKTIKHAAKQIRKQLEQGTSNAKTTAATEGGDRLDSFVTDALEVLTGKDYKASSLLSLHQSFSHGSLHNKLPWNSTTEEIQAYTMREVSHQLEALPSEARHKHLLHIESSLAQLEDDAKVEMILQDLKVKKLIDVAAQQKKFADAVPDILEKSECAETAEWLAAGKTIEFAINMEFPNIAEALMKALYGDASGVLAALIPEILLMAIPNVRPSSVNKQMDDCASLLDREASKEKCENALPVMTCAARTYQQLLLNAVREKWYPMNEGDRLPDVNAVMKGLLKVDERTCLTMKAKSETAVAEAIRSTDFNSDFHKTLCPVLTNEVDQGLEGPNKTDLKIIWSAGLLAHGAEINDHPDAGDTCPNFFPFAVAWCAEQLGCAPDVHLIESTMGAKAKANNKKKEKDKKKKKKTKKNKKDPASTALIEVEQNAPGSKTPKKAAPTLARLDEDGNGKVTKDELIKFFKKLTAVPSVDALSGNQEDAQWNMIWEAVKLAQGIMNPWQDIKAGVLARAQPVDWATTVQSWNALATYMLTSLYARENDLLKNKLLDGRPVYDLLHDIQQVYKSQMCGSAGPGDLDFDQLLSIGVRSDAAKIQVKQAAQGGSSPWVLLKLHFKVGYTCTFSDPMRKLLAALKKLQCTCMCMQTGSTYLPGRARGTCEKDQPKALKLEAIRASSVHVSAKAKLFDARSSGEFQSLGQTTVAVMDSYGQACSKYIAFVDAGGKSYAGYYSTCGGPDSLNAKISTLEGKCRGYVFLPLVVAADA
eukprot:TRINITY_DN68158_c0_g1_i1.p1 TRINITY_DN68158_c0_g1~~TRINITY_DN68158_c0_g1_i1.p1  ORF type:complete len:967 (+),score=151.76 TRINITY_DN68158_c0_g1_i1:40-2940(+)